MKRYQIPLLIAVLAALICCPGRVSAKEEIDLAAMKGKVDAEAWFEYYNFGKKIGYSHKSWEALEFEGEKCRLYTETSEYRDEGKGGTVLCREETKILTNTQYELIAYLKTTDFAWGGTSHYMRVADGKLESRSTYPDENGDPAKLERSVEAGGPVYIIDAIAKFLSGKEPGRENIQSFNELDTDSFEIEEKKYYVEKVKRDGGRYFKIADVTDPGSQDDTYATPAGIVSPYTDPAESSIVFAVCTRKEALDFSRKTEKKSALKGLKGKTAEYPGLGIRIKSPGGAWVIGYEDNDGMKFVGLGNEGFAVGAMIMIIPMPAESGKGLYDAIGEIFLNDLTDGGGEVLSEGDAEIKGLDSYRVEFAGDPFGTGVPVAAKMHFVSLYGTAAIIWTVKPLHGKQEVAPEEVLEKYIEFFEPVEKEAEWTAYKNDELCLGFKYPDDFEMTPQAGQLFNANGFDGNFCVILMKANPRELKIEGAAAEFKTGWDAAFETSGTITDVKLGGKAVKLYSCTSTSTGDVELVYRNYVFECREDIYILIFVNVPGKEMSETRDKIVDSFEFWEAW